MQGVITFENVTFLIAIFGVAFGVFHFFRNPDIKASEEIEKIKIMFNIYKELATKTELTATNHLNTIDHKLDGILSEQKNMSNQIVEMRTIINERIPRK